MGYVNADTKDTYKEVAQEIIGANLKESVKTLVNTALMRDISKTKKDFGRSG